MGLGVFFDWGGVIIDSSRHHEQSCEVVAAGVQRVVPQKDRSGPRSA